MSSKQKEKSKQITSNVVRFRSPRLPDSKAVNSDRIIANVPKEVYNQIKTTLAEIASWNGDNRMDWQEKYLDKLDRDIGEMKNSLKFTEERIADMISQTLSDMRDRDKQRHEEILALRNDIQAIRTDNAETKRWIIGMVISAIGVALAAIIGIVSVVYQIIK